MRVEIKKYALHIFAYTKSQLETREHKQLE